MKELALSNDLQVISSEIIGFKRLAGQSIFEIGMRIKHVKENDLSHGQFEKWLDSIRIEPSSARKMMAIAEELTSNRSTLNDLGMSVLYLIATLPDNQKQEQLERIENGDNPTVRELQEIKRENNRLKAENTRLEQQKENLAEQAVKQEVIEKEVIKEVIPDDYESTKQLNQTLLGKNKELSKMVDDALQYEEYLKSQLKEFYAKRDEVNHKSAKYDELTEAIKQSEGKLNSYQKKIASYKNITELLKKGDLLLLEMSGLIYADETHYIQRDGLIKQEFDSLVNRGLKLFNDLDMKRKNTDVLEGEVL
ncbi:TPA: DUF3102 domain-containing protein [Streptococcus pyogenes]|uniref:hypothetical protein n=1 Tax=Streptococcus pyogenes TaxID=1314 RepID=UPI0003051E1D|nr:hypothetical protein [Streptococcus pyogenes]HER4823783.1 DUF3102 domain-containing protein [Streptococcus pyogenes NGAS015]AUG50526.1 DUF3102 domain-containing protein [Streptococcus pyogenes]MCX2499613.1 DUF3102 domain-containing protein [Streptococcus pyogenes]MCX2507716.1 DUF3102 domain-containing protein [Streptococcus pyogenes]OAC59733.1 hypothetical protein AWU03_04680 [Streptococcus pyogenes]